MNKQQLTFPTDFGGDQPGQPSNQKVAVKQVKQKPSGNAGMRSNPIASIKELVQKQPPIISIATKKMSS